MVSTPTLPKYIYKIMRYWERTLIFAVPAALKPTVAIAEAASYRASVKPKPEVAEMKMPPKMASHSLVHFLRSIK